MSNLFEISKVITDLLENGEHVDPETGEFLDLDDLDSVELSFNDKVDNCVMYVKSLEAEAAAIKAEEQNIAARRKAKENQAESLKRYVARCFDMTGKKKFETPRCKLSWRESSRVEVYDEAIVPDDFKVVKTTVSVDKRRIATELKDAGDEEFSIPGATLVRSRSLQIK